MSAAHSLPKPETAPAEPSWLVWARREVGQKEVPGGKHNGRILFYHRFTLLKATADEVPWCAAFGCASLEEQGIRSPRSAAARDFLKWGKKLDIPRVGCFVVFSRGSNPASGHVAIYLRTVGNEIEVLGGNQGDAVCVTRYPKSRLLGYRWPD